MSYFDLVTFQEVEKTDNPRVFLSLGFIHFHINPIYVRYDYHHRKNLFVDTLDKVIGGMVNDGSYHNHGFSWTSYTEDENDLVFYDCKTDFTLKISRDGLKRFRDWFDKESKDW